MTAVNKVGGEFLVNSAVAGDQGVPTITGLADGGFVVSWTDYSQGGDSSGYAIKAQIYNAAGARVGSEFLVNSAVASYQQFPTITGLANGGFVVSWTDYSQGNGGAGGDSSRYAIKAQIYDAAGARVGGEFLVNSAVASDQAYPTITGLADGGFVVSWTDYSQGVGGAGGDSSSYAIKAQVYNAAGARVGGEFLVNSAVESNQEQPTITGLADGGFVVSWTDGSHGVGGAGGDSSGTAIKAQVYDAAGARVGGEFLVNSAVESYQQFPTITGLANGGFVVSWTDYSQGNGGAGGDSSGWAIKAQIYDAASARVGSEFLVNSAVESYQYDPTITGLADGGFVVSWSTGDTLQDGSGTAIKAQLFTPAGTRVGGEFFVNSAVSGSQQSPTITGLANGGFVVSWMDASQGNGGAGGDSSGAAIKAQIFRLVADNAAPDAIMLTDMSAIDEALSTGRIVGTLVVSDRDVNDVHSFSILSDPTGGAFAVVDGQLTVADGTKLDYEAQTSVDILIRATDLAGAYVEQTLTIGIEDVNETIMAIPTGSEFLVSNAAVRSAFDPAIEGLKTGELLVSWISGSSTVAQLFATDGTKIGDEFRIDNLTSSFSYTASPAVASLANGGFVASWSEEYYTGDDFVLRTKAQLLDSRGTKIGSEFVVNDKDSGDGAVIAALENGSFVISWADYLSRDYDVKAQIFNANGTKIGSTFLVSSQTSDDQIAPAIADLGNGGFVVSWATRDATQDGSGSAIKAQIFDAGGAKIGSEFLVNSHTAQNQLSPTITGLANGGFVASWVTTNSAERYGVATGTAIKAQLFDAGGAKIGSELFVNSQESYSLSQPVITSLTDGGFLVSWHSVSRVNSSQNPGENDVKAQLFDANGHKIGGEFLVNSDSTEGPGAPTATGLPDGRFAVSWSTFEYSQGVYSSAIKAKIFEIGPVASTPLITSDGGGDTAAISIAENGFAITTVQASDADGDALTYAISGGADAALFGIDTETGTLAFLAAPDFEAPGDADGDNVYEVVVRASDGSQFDDQAIAVTITDVNEAVSLTGDEGNNSLNGTGFDDTLSGLGGNDTLNGLDGDDSLTGGLGDDILNGGDGIGDVAKYAGQRNGYSISRDGTRVTDIDPADGDDGVDQLSGVELYQFSNGTFSLGIMANPTINGTAGNDGILTTRGDDVVSAGSGDDVIYGSAGTDTIDGGAGSDGLYLYTFQDVFPVATAARVYTITDSRITDSSGAIDMEISGVERVGLSTVNSPHFDDIIDASGFTGAGGVYLDVLGSRQTVAGSARDDTISVRGGRTDVTGGNGHDLLQVGLVGLRPESLTAEMVGDDVVLNSTAGDRIVFRQTEQLQLYASRDTAKTVDLSAISIDTEFQGSVGNDQFIGGSGNDLFNEGLGADAFTGGLGSDRFIIYGFDRFDGDTFTDFSADDYIDMSSVRYNGSIAPAFIGTAAFSGIAGQVRYEKAGATTLLQADGNGDGVADATLTISNGAFDLQETSEGSSILQIKPLSLSLVGTSGNDTLVGTPADETLSGLAGNDILRAGDGSDLLNGGTGDDKLYGGGAADHLLGDNGNDVLDGGVGADLLQGGAGNDKLLGNTGNDILDGGAGNDILVGGAGADRLTGGDGADIFRFLLATDSLPGANSRDIVTDFDAAEGDIIDLSRMDANGAAVLNNGAFVLKNGSIFGGTRGELIQTAHADGVVLKGDINGDKIADIAILVLGVSSIGADHFLL